MFSKFFKKQQTPVDLAEAYSGLRDQILHLRPEDAGIQPSSDMPGVWGILMETGYARAIATLVSLADGTTSLYFSNGGGMIGGGQHATVAQATRSFVAAAEHYVQHLTRAESFPLPAMGRVKFYILAYSGTYTIDSDEQQLGNRQHELSPLFYQGQHVITQLRLIQQQNE